MCRRYNLKKGKILVSSHADDSVKTGCCIKGMRSTGMSSSNQVRSMQRKGRLLQPMDSAVSTVKLLLT